MGKLRRTGADEIRVSVTGHTTPSGKPFTILSKILGDANPTTMAPAGIPRPRYYDVFVDGITGGTAKVSITCDSLARNSPMRYWDKPGGTWVDVKNRSIAGGTISGDIPVSALHGTPIVIGTN